MKRQAVVAFAVLGASALIVAAALFVYDRLGRTPGEIIDHVELRLRASSPTLDAAFRPALEAVRRWLGEPDSTEQSIAFVVPPLPPNPASVQQPGAAMVAGTTSDAATLGAAKVIRVGPGRAITSLAMASTIAQDGGVIEIDPGDYRADVAIWDRSELTIRGVGPRVRLIAAGRHAEGKAIWVIRRGNVVVEGIDFIGARVPDRNGAGIRLEGGHLVVRRCAFIDNENGILTAGDGGARLEVENSEFGYNGAGDGRSHGIYAGAIDYLRVSGSYFHHGNVGHLIKTRARVSRIEYNRISDESGGRASYELEFTNGGLADVVGNVIQQSQQTLNPVMVSFGAEGYDRPDNRLRMAFNTLVNDRRQGGTFIRIAEPRGAGPVAVELRENVLAGRGMVDVPAGSVSSGEHRVDRDSFVHASNGDFRLTEAARRLAVRATPQVPGPERARREWLPAFEYIHPRQTRALTQGLRVAGAIQAQ